MFMLWQCDEPCTPAKWRERAEFAYVISLPLSRLVFAAAGPRGVAPLELVISDYERSAYE